MDLSESQVGKFCAKSKFESVEEAEEFLRDENYERGVELRTFSNICVEIWSEDENFYDKNGRTTRGQVIVTLTQGADFQPVELFYNGIAIKDFQEYLENKEGED